MDVGFVGLGQMGSGMASRLVDAGHNVIVWNRDAGKTSALAEAGAAVARSPREAAEAGVVITMLGNDAALEAVCGGDDGIMAAGPGVLHVSCSTVGVGLTRRLADEHAAAKQQFVSAQVLGRPKAAAWGQLAVLAAGEREAIDRCAPFLSVVGNKTIRLGAEPAAAAAAKLAANFSLASVIETVTEAFAIAGTGGVSKEALLDLFAEVNFGTRMFGAYGKIIADDAFEPAAFPLTLGRKDLGLGLDALGPDADAPIARLLATRMDRLIAAGRGEQDWASLGQPLPEGA